MELKVSVLGHKEGRLQIQFSFSSLPSNYWISMWHVSLVPSVHLFYHHIHLYWIMSQFSFKLDPSWSPTLLACNANYCDVPDAPLQIVLQNMVITPAGWRRMMKRSACLMNIDVQLVRPLLNCLIMAFFSAVPWETRDLRRELQPSVDRRGIIKN